MEVGVDAALMEINAVIFLVRASPSDLAVGEDGAAATMVIVKIVNGVEMTSRVGER